jgi:hypothetical protein
MNIEITEQKTNGVILQAQSEDGRYQWSSLQAGVHDTVTGRRIHQMAYLKRPGEGFGSDPLPEDVAADVRAFYEALDPLVEARRQAADHARIEQEAAEIDECEALQRKMGGHMAPEDR